MINRTKPVICVESLKGGPGKSTFSTIAMGWHAMHDDTHPILIETDPVNSDVALVYAEDMDSVNETHKGKKCDIFIFNTVNTDEEEAKSACVALVDTIVTNPDRTIIVNAPRPEHRHKPFGEHLRVHKPGNVRHDVHAGRRFHGGSHAQ